MQADKQIVPQTPQSFQKIQEVVEACKVKAFWAKQRTPYNVAFARDYHHDLKKRLKIRDRRHGLTATITMQGELLKVHCHAISKRTGQGGERGAITGFSPRARKNMLETVSRIDWTKHNATFITLTYHVLVPSAKVCKTHLRTLQKRLYRRFGLLPNLWKLEPQKRGAWHFHLIVWDMPYMPQKELLAWWQEIAGQPTITQVRIELIGNAHKARSYVAKYAGKDFDSSLFNYMSNLPGWENPGRFWGVENRKNITWMELITYTAVMNKGFFDFKRACRRFQVRVNQHRHRGWTIFQHDLQMWRIILEAYVEPCDLCFWCDWLRREVE